MNKALWLCVCCLSACSLGDTAVTAAAAGKSKAAEIEQTKALEQQIANDVQQAQQLQEQRLRDLESTESK